METSGITLRRLKTFLTNLKDIFAEKNHSHATSDITGLDNALSSKATSTQGAKADTAVQSVKIGTTEYKSGTTVTLPSYPTSLPASDVSAWAKASTKPSYTKSDVGLGNVDNTADVNKSVKYATSAGNASNLSGFTSDSAGFWNAVNATPKAGKCINRMNSPNGGGIAFSEHDTIVDMVIDGKYYQDEGRYMCLDTNNYLSYAAEKNHTHAIDSKLSETSTNAVQNKIVTTALNDKIDKIGGAIATCGGNGTYTYFKIATIKIKGSYINQPIVFELSGRGKKISLLTVIFNSTNTSDPTLNTFCSNEENSFYIKKTATSTWEIYGQYSEPWGGYVLHRITGAGLNSTAISVQVDMTNISSLPSECIQATYTGNVAYALNSASVNNHTVNCDVPANAKFTDTNTTYPIYNKEINANYATAYRTQTKGNANSGNYISNIRIESNATGAPAYGAGLAWGSKDTHGYLNVNYSTRKAFLGGGNVDNLNWVGEIAFTNDIPTVVNNLTTTATGYALDAVQGKALNDLITSLNSNRVITESFYTQGITITSPIHSYANLYGFTKDIIEVHAGNVARGGIKKLNLSIFDLPNNVFYNMDGTTPSVTLSGSGNTITLKAPSSYWYYFIIRYNPNVTTVSAL